MLYWKRRPERLLFVYVAIKNAKIFVENIREGKGDV
jgi:hypothetical protein